MDFEKYENKKILPNKKRHTTYKYYDKVEKKEIVKHSIDNNNKNHIYIETIVDEEYELMRKEYYSEEDRLEELFKSDLFEEFDIPKGSKFAEALYQYAHSNICSEDYEKIFNSFNGISHLYTLAKNEFSSFSST